MDVSSQHVTNVPHTEVWDTDGGEAVYGTEQKIVGTSCVCDQLCSQYVS